MKDRIAELIEKEGLTPSKFADLINVQRSNISHILAGRNKPSLDFLQKIMLGFPAISGDWLLSGTGPMYKGGSEIAESNNPQQESRNDDLFTTEQHTEPTPSPSVQPRKPQKSDRRMVIESGSAKRIKKIVVIYDDFSMDEFILDKHLE